MNTGAIQFTQYVMPHGHPRRVTIDRPIPVVDQARKLIEIGCRLEAEVLTTGEVSFTVEREMDNNGPTDFLASEIVPNGPGVAEAVDRLIADAFRAAFSSDGR